MNVKVRILHFNLQFFPENLGHYSEEQGEHFHQDLKENERKYQGVLGINIMADYLWTLKRETTKLVLKDVVSIAPIA